MKIQYVIKTKDSAGETLQIFDELKDAKKFLKLIKENDKERI